MCVLESCFYILIFQYVNVLFCSTVSHVRQGLFFTSVLNDVFELSISKIKFYICFLNNVFMKIVGKIQCSHLVPSNEQHKLEDTQGDTWSGTFHDGRLLCPLRCPSLPFSSWSSYAKLNLFSDAREHELSFAHVDKLVSTGLAPVAKPVSLHRKLIQCTMWASVWHQLCKAVGKIQRMSPVFIFSPGKYG